MIERLIQLLSFIAERVKKALRSREQEESQDERDKLEGSPADWYSDHFGGVRSDNAGEADKDNPERRRG